MIGIFGCLLFSFAWIPKSLPLLARPRFHSCLPETAPRYPPVDLDKFLKDNEARHQHLIDLVYPSVINQVNETRKKAIEHFKNGKRVHKYPYPLGSIVMIYNSDRKSKTDPLYLGPGTVVHVNRNSSYSVRLNPNDVLHKIPISHLKLISRVPIENPRLPSSFSQADSPSVAVKAILSHNFVGDSMDYLVQWKDSSIPFSWVHAKDFDDPKLVTAYWKSLEHSTHSGPKLTIKFKNPNFTSRGGRCDTNWGTHQILTSNLFD